MGHCRTTSISLARTMLTHLPHHRKNYPLWRKHRLQARTACSRFPPIRSLSLEGQLRAAFGGSTRVNAASNETFARRRSASVYPNDLVLLRQ
jgi:hypothetical protein